MARPMNFTMASLWLGSLLACTSAHALYKVVGPDGKVSYTDRPPAESSSANKVLPMAPATGGGSSNAGLEGLPTELRQVATRYPVVLYVTSSCDPCDQGRNLLKKRGIPFVERQVVTGEDSDALQTLTGGREAPVMVVGSQVNRGFAPEVWQKYLDAAGYPATSRLPSNYVYSAPTPLTERKTIAAPQPPSAPPPPRRPATPPAPPPATAPSGIQF